ncbi:hypothetical protein [Mycobacterium tuberculosis]|uniref:hypothetical protein n=1 Tax=Mycobacterium tuberculosis TaxID=1773 RepID=UPI00272BFABB|nr:hypothetical protein [Mycobacterium tuberculosis]
MRSLACQQQRELENLLHRAVALSEGGELSLDSVDTTPAIFDPWNSWRGTRCPVNVRELENLLHRAVALSEGGELSLDSVDTTPAIFDPKRSTTGSAASLNPGHSN